MHNILTTMLNGSNPRTLISGMPCPNAQVAQPAMPPGVFKLLTSVLRTANNILGGISFVTLAKITGVQSSAGDDKKSAEVGSV